jgi:hypothetical protein
MNNLNNLKTLFLVLALTVLGATETFAVQSISGKTKICPGAIETYSVTGTLSCNGSCTDDDGTVHSNELILNWNVVGGTITSGIGTSEITVQWDNYSNCNGASFSISITSVCVSWVKNGKNCIDSRSTLTSSINIEKTCPTILSADIPEIDCCPDPTKVYTLEIRTNLDVNDLEIEWPTGLEPKNPRTLVIDGEIKRFKFEFTANSNFNSGTLIATANSCTKKISHVVNYPISRKYKKSKFSATSSPKALCIGSVGTYCIDFGEPCYNISYQVFKYSGSGQPLGSTNPVNNGNNPCFSVTASPISTSPIDNNQYMIIKVTVTALCNPQGEELELKVKTPITPPLTSGNSPVPTGPTVICACRSNFVLLADSSEASDMVELELTNNPNQTWQNTALKCITCEFQPNFCSQFLFGVHQVTGPFQDITVRYRRHNICGWGPWMQTVIPASYFYPDADGSPECPLTN